MTLEQHDRELLERVDNRSMEISNAISTRTSFATAIDGSAGAIVTNAQMASDGVHIKSAGAAQFRTKIRSTIGYSADTAQLLSKLALWLRADRGVSLSLGSTRPWCSTPSSPGRSERTSLVRLGPDTGSPCHE